MTETSSADRTPTIDAPAGAATNNAAANPEAASPRSNRTFFAIIAAMVLFWAAVLVLRPALQARYFAWHLLREQSQPDAYRHYFERLVSLGDSGIAGVEMLLESDEPRHRAMGAQALRFMSAGAARPLLVECLSDPDASVRRAAAMSLARDESADVVAAFSKMMESNDEATAALGAGMLGRMGGDVATAALRAALAGDPRLQVKAEAIDGLGQMHDRASAGAMLTALEDDRPLRQKVEFDQLASEALRQVQPKLLGTLPANTSAMGLLETPATVSEVAARALRRITGEPIAFRAGMPADQRQAAIAQFRAAVESAATSQPAGD